VTEIAACQEKIGSGYLSAFPEEFFDRLESGRRVWVPWYTIHKLYQGLLDVHALTGNRQALDCVRKAVSWVEKRTGKLSEARMQEVLNVEHGGMMDVLARYYAVTGDETGLKLAMRFWHRRVLDPLVEGRDPLTGLHANTQFPKLQGVARLYDLTGDEKYMKAVLLAWDSIVKRRSYATGGNSDGECLTDPERLSKAIGPRSAETCNVHNMLKLARQVFCWEPKAAYADYYERCMFNQILASQDPANGMVTYYQPLVPCKQQPGSTVGESGSQSCWCCCGTGIENHATHGSGIYFHDGDRALYVNLFVASRLDWKTAGVVVRQDTAFPETDSARFTIACGQPKNFALKIRRPAWSANGFTIAINGERQSLNADPGSYCAIERTWKDGDTVDVHMPMALRVEAFNNDPGRVALLYGPIVLCAWQDLAGEEPVILAGDTNAIIKAVRAVEGKPLTFTACGSFFRGAREATPDVTLVPFYRHWEKGLAPYKIYWDVKNPQSWDGYWSERNRQRRVDIQTESRPEAAKAAGFYTPNRTPLQPSAFMKLPLGSVTPRGWLRHQLALDAGGITGRFEEISKFLKFDDTGWVTPEKRGWEEPPYWLRGYVSLAYTLKDENLIANAKRWIEAILATRKPDGYFGPENLRSVEKGKAESFSHQCMVYPMRSYYEATGDRRALDAMIGFYRWLDRQPELYFKSGWGASRWSEHLYGVYWVYNETGESWLLDLAKKIHERTANWTTAIPTAHNVNFSQGVREPGEYWLQAKDKSLLDAVELHYSAMMSTHGQFPGGGFAGDEGRRPGYVDPRQGFETCGYIELMLTDEIMTRIAADPVWSDRCEEIAFNSLPAALTPDHRALHYITSANSVQLDSTGKNLGQFGNGPFAMQAFAPSPHNYRCCPHNYGMAWPYFTESLWLATWDGGLCASLYSPSEVRAKVGDGTKVAIAEETDYPFSDTIAFSVETPKPVRFPLWLRVPRWCNGASVTVNGEPVPVQPSPSCYIVVTREWRDSDKLVLRLPMRPGVRTWAQNRNSVSVDYGPLTFALDIKEKPVNFDPEKNPQWPGTELFAASPWNYGLELDPRDPAKSFEICRKPGPLAANPFTKEGAPISLRAKARKIPGWQADEEGVVGPLQQSPALTKEPFEPVTLVPMGAARLRIASFPTVTTGSEGHEWQAPPRAIAKVTASFTESPWGPQALFYGIEPANSHDQTVPRFTWWNRSGTREWIRYKFPKPATVSAVAVYWYDDQGAKDWFAGSGAFATPKSWSLEYNDGNTWKPVTPAGDYGTALDRYNRVEFKPIVTTMLRLVVQMQRGRCAGIYAWKVFNGDLQLVPTMSATAEKTLTAGAAMPSAQGNPVAETWFKPEMLKDIADGQVIAQWHDGAVGGNDAGYVLGASPPTVARNAINGLPVAHFEAEKHQALAFQRSIEDDFTIAVVYRSRQGAGTGRHFCLGAGLVQGDVPGPKDDFGISLNAKGELLAGVGNPDTTIVSPPGFNDGQPHLVIFTREKSTGALALFVDGRRVATGKGGTQALDAPLRIGLGANAFNHNHFTGDIGEVAVFSRALNDTQRKAVEEQLTTQWGIQADAPKEHQ